MKHSIDRTSIPARHGGWMKQLLDGKDLTIEEANLLMNEELIPLEELLKASKKLTERTFGKQVSMCAIYAAKVGRCSGDCAFCAQSAHHQSAIAPVDVSQLDAEAVVENATRLYRQGVQRYSLVTSAERLSNAEFERILGIYRRLRKETEIQLCASLGSLDMERAERLKDAGVRRYHHNLETSRSYFPRICSTHTYEDKLETIRIVKRAGMELCCGGILSMGETPEQRVEMAFALKELDVDCVPINILNPIPGTRLEHQQLLGVQEILRTIAVFRLVLRDKSLRFAGGRENAMGEEEYKGYAAGINSTLVGNYLTTSGKPFEKELEQLAAAGVQAVRNA